MHDDYVYRTGDSVEVESSPGEWKKGIFQSYYPIDINKNHNFNITILRANKTYTIHISPERVKIIKNASMDKKEAMDI